MKLSLPAVLSLNAGYVDTAGYLALHGLFTAHVTGNFVTFGAALVHGSTGAIAKLLALPVFCGVIIATRLFSYGLQHWKLPVLPIMLGIKLALLTLGAVLAVRLAPFDDGDAWPALVTGMVLVAAMAIQNAAHRIHLGSAPPTTLMTGTTTQIMIDAADLIYGATADSRPAIKARMKRMALSVGAFAVGCGAAALAFDKVDVRCFVVPPVLAALALALRRNTA